MAILYSISELCEAARISRGMYFKLKKQGLGPREVSLGRRVLISEEAAREWVRRLEHGARAA
jgi:hypothetical protein